MNRFSGVNIQKNPEIHDINYATTANSIRNNYSYITTANTPRKNNKMVNLSHSKQGNLDSKDKKIFSEKYLKTTTEALTQAIEEDQKSLEDNKNTVSQKNNNNIPKDTYYDFSSFSANKQANNSFVYSPNKLQMEGSSASLKNKVI